MVPPKMMSFFDGRERMINHLRDLLNQVEAHALTALSFSSFAETARSRGTSEESGLVMV
jgi:hypothetical protein